jgi:glycosyltransferase involved in cell wall biosynthesis
MKLSIIFPVYNEAENLRELYSQTKDALAKLGSSYEIIAVNDGSVDDSAAVLQELATIDSSFRVINFKKNHGQTAAISAGIDFSVGDVIVLLDADLQNDPADIPSFLVKIGEGFDVVSGWRRHRKDNLISRKIPSWIANGLISLITGVSLHDYGCTLKAYKREAIGNIRLYGEMHRFIPAYSAWCGAKIAEIPVNHRPRQFGHTKYGLSRTFRVILDLVTVKILTKYLSKPMHFFGWVGFWALFFGLFFGVYSLYLKFFKGVFLISTPLPLLTVLLSFVGIQFILMGLLAEILIRVYYEASNQPPYLIKNKINFKN